MEDGYTQLGTVLTDRRPEDSEGDGVIVVGRFKGHLRPRSAQLRSWPAKPVPDPRGGAAPGIPARGGSRNGYRHPVGITGCRWLTTEIRLLGLTYGRPDIAPEAQRGALSIALIPGGGRSVGISRPKGCRTAQDQLRAMQTLCASRTCRSRRCTPEVTGPTDVFLAAEIH